MVPNSSSPFPRTSSWLGSSLCAFSWTPTRCFGGSPTIHLALRFDAVLAAELFESLPITSAHAARAGLLPGPHKDPFDRTFIAQAQAENLPILSNDSIFDTYKLRRLWD